MHFIKKLCVLFFATALSILFLSQAYNIVSSKTEDHKILRPQDLGCTFYKWFSPNTSEKEGKLLLKNCSSCHMAYYNEWKEDKHSMSQSNPFFLSVYSDFKKDHPNQNGNCALCHNPEAALDNNLDVDLRKLKIKKSNGISCDFCHKVESIDQDQFKKGVDGLNILRVCKGMRDVRFGPLKDPIQPSDKEELRYNSIYKTSLYCAKCHDGSNGNVQIYSTFTEWLNSPAAKRGVQCQSCHMAPTSKNSIVDNSKVKHKVRPYYQIHSHSFLTENPHEFRKKYIDLKVSTRTENNILKVTCKVENNNFGHSFPTGSPMRNVVLVIDVKDKNGNELKQTKGLKLPNYAGDLKGKSGKLFAKILAETSGEYGMQHGKAGIKFRKLANKIGIPAQDWWNVFIGSDTRIKANESDISTYEFDLGSTDAKNIEVTTKLIWRNTWPGLAKIKGIKLQEDLLIIHN